MPHGKVESCKIIIDHDTGRSKGFGFVAMENAETVMKELNGKEFGGRTLKINEAKKSFNGARGDGQPRENGYGGGYNRRDNSERDNRREYSKSY